MKTYRVKFEGIVASMILPDEKVGNFIILCYGLPGYPPHHQNRFVLKLVENGFSVIIPEYTGSFSSGGVCNILNSIETIQRTVVFLFGNCGLDYWSNKSINWLCNKISIVGASFGGSVALVCGAKSPKIKNIVSISGPTNYRDHNKKYKEEDLEGLYDIISEVYGNVWRVDKASWDIFLNGEIDINPVDYIKELMNKNVFLVHSKDDETTCYKRSLELNESIKSGNGVHEILILETGGHVIFQSLKEETADKIIVWLKSLS